MNLIINDGVKNRIPTAPSHTKNNTIRTIRYNYICSLKYINEFIFAYNVGGGLNG